MHPGAVGVFLSELPGMDHRADKLDLSPFPFPVFAPIEHLKASQTDPVAAFRNRKFFFPSHVSGNIGLGFQIPEDKRKHLGRIKCLIGNNRTNLKTKLIPDLSKLRDDHTTVYHISRSGFFDKR